MASTSTKKESFYKTHEEKLLARAVDYMYNWAIGGNENDMLDGNEYHAWKEDELIYSIIDDILSCRTYLEIENSWEVLEAKHIRFMGKERVREIVTHRVQFRHTKEGNWLWEN